MHHRAQSLRFRLAARRCDLSGVIVILPPSRMLAVAKSFTTSAPSAFILCTYARIAAGSPVFSLTAAAT